MTQNWSNFCIVNITIYVVLFQSSLKKKMQAFKCFIKLNFVWTVSSILNAFIFLSKRRNIFGSYYFIMWNAN